MLVELLGLSPNCSPLVRAIAAGSGFAQAAAPEFGLWLLRAMQQTIDVTDGYMAHNPRTALGAHLGALVGEVARVA
jgi:hypothetical protein